MTEIEIYKSIVQKQDEFIRHLWPDGNCTLCDNYEKELASLRQQLEKLDQCKNILEKVKEAWTPDKRSFEEAEADKKENNCNNCKYHNYYYYESPCCDCNRPKYGMLPIYDKWEPIKTE